MARLWQVELSPLPSANATHDRATRTKALREALLSLFPDQDRARMVAEDCGLRVTRINFDGEPDVVWHRVIQEASRDPSGRPLACLEAVVEQERRQLLDPEPSAPLPEPISAPRLLATPVTPSSVTLSASIQRPGASIAIQPALALAASAPTAQLPEPSAAAPIIRVLLLDAQPDQQVSLRVGREVRELKERLRAGRDGERFDIMRGEATTTRDLLALLREVKPDIVHFSGHGSAYEGIALELPGGDVAWVDGTTLARVLQRNQEREGRLKLVVLNAGAFSVAFYQALGQGACLLHAFQDGSDLIAMEHPGQEDIPRLLCREGLDPASLAFL